MAIIPEDPQSRIEEWLALIAGQTGIDVEEPQSRVEKWLAYIAEKGGGGSWDGVLTDRTTGKKYTLFMDNGKVGVEEVV